MKCLVGLGNPGKQYESTRHNAGYLMVDYVENRLVAKNRYIKYDAHVAEVKNDDFHLLLIKPTTFMNRSGISVAQFVRFYKLSAEDIYICHDDLDLSLGSYKIQRRKGPQLHNGIASIEENLGIKDFYRVRIGIDAREGDERSPGEAYVMARFSDQEMEALTQIFSLTYQALYEKFKTVPDPQDL